MNTDLIAMLEYLEREKGIQRETLIEAISGALVTASKKSFTGGTRNLRIDIDPKNGNIRAMAKLFVVESVSNPHDEIALGKIKTAHPEAQRPQGLVPQREAYPLRPARRACSTRPLRVRAIPYRA